MFAALDRMCGSRRTHATREEPMTTISAFERNHSNHERNQFTGGLGPGLQRTFFATPRASQLTTHMACISYII